MECMMCLLFRLKHLNVSSMVPFFLLNEVLIGFLYISAPDRNWDTMVERRTAANDLHNEMHDSSKTSWLA